MNLELYDYTPIVGRDPIHWPGAAPGAGGRRSPEYSISAKAGCGAAWRRKNAGS